MVRNSWRPRPPGRARVDAVYLGGGAHTPDKFGLDVAGYASYAQVKRRCAYVHAVSRVSSERPGQRGRSRSSRWPSDTRSLANVRRRVELLERLKMVVQISRPRTVRAGADAILPY